MDFELAARHIEQFLADTCGVGPTSIARDDDWFDAEVLDSMNLVLLLAHIEQQWGVEIDMATLRMDDYRSIASAARTVVRLVAGGEAPR